MNLTTRYLGFTRKNPLIPSASPLSDPLDAVKRLEDAGAAEIVLSSRAPSAISSICAA